MRWRLLLFTGLFAGIALAQPKPAAKDAPVILYPIPLTIPATGKVKLVLRGQKLETVSEIKSADAKVTVKLVGKGRKALVPNNYPANKLGDTECDVELEFAAGYSPTQVSLSAINSGGTSEAYSVIAVAKPNPEKEPNDTFAAAQKIALPIAVEGTIAKDRDVDVFAFEGKKGQMMKFAVRARKLGAPTDALLTLYDDARNVLALVDDTEGSSDPVLIAKLPRDGTYYLSVIEANDLGGPQFGYRLIGE